MSIASHRLREAREKAGIDNATDAAVRFGWQTSTYLGHENGSRGISPEKAMAYGRAFGVPPEWILFGKHAPDMAAVERVPVGQSGPPGSTLIPIYNVFASAGPGAEVAEYEMVTDRLSFPDAYLRTLTGTNPRDLQIIGVIGNSMEPTLKHDDIVMLDRTKIKLIYEGLFVIRYGGVLQVKRLSWSERKGYVTIVSDNKAHPPRDYPADEVEVIGKVIWKGGKE